MSPNPSISFDASLLPQLMHLSRNGYQVLLYVLIAEMKGKADANGFLKVRYAEVMNMCAMSSSSQVADGLNDLMKKKILQRGPIAGYYKLVSKAIKLIE